MATDPRTAVLDSPLPRADSSAPACPVRRALRADQQAAVDRGVSGLRKPGSRGHMVSACGTGKTLIALRTAEALKTRFLLVVVPSRDLIGQWAAAARADGRTEALMAVSSLNANKHPVLAEAGAVSTSSGEYLAYWLAQRAKKREPATVFVTLDSLRRIEEIQHSVFPAPAFDLTIIDEAHRTAGSWDKEWTVIHDSSRIRTDRRLYLTATPYEWEAPRLAEAPDARPRPKRTASTVPAWESPSLIASMDDPKVFGPRLHTYTHAEAIEDGVLADYQLLVPTITDTDLRTVLTDPDGAHTGFAPTARRTTALHLAVLKAMTEHDLKHVIVYFQQVADAADFARQFGHTLRTLPPEQRPPWAGTLSVSSINGNHTPDQRAKLLDRFAKADRAVITNAQVLSEGIDLPAVDAIVFASRTESVRRIVQALGRALRKPPTVDVKTASLVIPAYTPPDSDPTDLLDTPYEALWLITAALRHHDQTIAARAPRKTTAHRLDDTTHRLITRRFRFDFTLDPGTIARAMDLIAWPSDSAVLSKPRRAGLAAAVRYHAEHRHLRVPMDYEDAYGYRLGQFIDGQRTAYTQGTLTADWIAELENLGMIWDAHEAAWQGHMATVDAFHATYGHLAIPATAPGGQFLVDQRALARKHQLAPDREAQLAALDADWTLPHGPDWHRKHHLLRRHIEAGNHPTTLRRDTVIDGVKVGSWLHRQFTTWNKLSDGQQALLTRLGLTPDQTSLSRREMTSGEALPIGRTRRTFEQTATLLRAFVERHGRTPSAREWIEVDGQRVMIGPWLCKTRTKQKTGQLPEKHSQLMRKILHDDWTEQPEKEDTDLSEIP
ncbi:Helicase associated domain protein [Streptomyces heilongjiangensis]|uniref:Helicase associated domain protein n=1 Tax=Streptomyces heilongjiangensis TaxID=945052 RepID=A0ABW1BJ61_9ACTN|nr:Helicase associated domain protein [Streptomyces heilongjiangensis]MDC2952234.1 Helicase associated domain protein [Streptomyces heilongjiangensis]